MSPPAASIGAAIQSIGDSEADFLVAILESDGFNDFFEPIRRLGSKNGIPEALLWIKVGVDWHSPPTRNPATGTIGATLVNTTEAQDCNGDDTVAEVRSSPEM
jgi:hypothetical protein